MFNIVLVEPEIPPNTGNVGRLCLATRSTLHLVGPLGFSIDDRQLKRAGLDYWDEVDVREWSSLDELRRANASARFFYLTTKATQPYFEIRLSTWGFLGFWARDQRVARTRLEENRESCITIPMHGTRSLNLATAVAIVLFEAVRQQTALNK